MPKKSIHKLNKLLFATFFIAAQAINTPATAENTSKNTPKNTHYCKNMASHLPGVSQKLCLQADLVDKGARSVKGVPLLKRDVITVNSETRQMWLDLLRWMGELVKPEEVSPAWLSKNPMKKLVKKG